MQDPVSELIERGRALSPADRERLVDQLLQSLNEPAVSELDAAWEIEIAQRLARYDHGESRAADAADVYARARSRAR
jgi:putative addiction module component (TIGR02574 family)